MEFEILDPDKITPFLNGANPIIFSSGYYDYCRIRYKAERVYVGAKTNGELKFILPVFTHSDGGVRTAEIPFSNYYCEPVFIDSDFEFNPAEVKRGLFQLLKADAVKFNIVDFSHRIKTDGYKPKFVAVILNTGKYDSAEELLKKNVTLRRRNQIRFSQKQGFDARVLDERHLEEFYELYKSHHRKKNYPVRAIDEIRNIFVAYKDKAKIAAIYKGDKIISAVLFIAHPPYLWLIINVSDFDYSYFQVNNCAYWEVIKYGYDNGIKFVDFGGTSLADKGNIHYKKGFGVDFYPVYSICFFRGWFTGFKYRLQRKIWHLKLRWRVMKNQPRAKQT